MQRGRDIQAMQGNQVISRLAKALQRRRILIAQETLDIRVGFTARRFAFYFVFVVERCFRVTATS